MTFEEHLLLNLCVERQREVHPHCFLILYALYSVHVLRNTPGYASWLIEELG